VLGGWRPFLPGDRDYLPSQHEFVITGQDRALIPAYRAVQADLSGLGGPK
jgi:hypothetical protein